MGKREEKECECENEGVAQHTLICYSCHRYDTTDFVMMSERVSE